MGDWFQDTAPSGSLLLAVPVALVAGLVSFFSPCVIPLLPGYLSYATGLSGADLANGDGRHPARPDAPRLAAVRARLLGGLRRCSAARSGALGTWLVELATASSRIVLGVVTILLGLAFAGLVPFLQRDWRIHKVPAVGLAAAPLLGFLFGLGWTPCLGPDPGRDHHALAQRGHRRPRRPARRRLRHRARRAVHRRRPGLRAVRSRRSAFVRRHQVWVMRLGGADAGRGRRRCWSPAGGPRRSPGCRSSLVDERRRCRACEHRRLSTRPPEDDRRPGELSFRELLRWVWRQLTSMRTALILLLLLALAAIPGSVIPQRASTP